MSRKLFILIFLLSAVSCAAFAGLRDLPYEREYKTQEFSISFTPQYPLSVGQETRVQIKTFIEADSVSVYAPGLKLVELKKEGNAWLGSFPVLDPKKEGWRFIYVYIKRKKPAFEKNLFDDFLNFIKFQEQTSYKTETIAKRIWFRAFAPMPKPGTSVYKKGQLLPTQEAFELQIFPSAETVAFEAPPLTIKGSRIFNFSSKRIEGTKESYLPGISREESLRLNVSGKAQDTEIDANFFSSSVFGATDASSREETVSILLRQGSYEAYFGDFTPYFPGLEFMQIEKVLSGLNIKGENEKWGWNAIASSPKGRSRLKKLYGDATQGPYSLGSSPVVINSEQVYVDNILQKRGNDYEIDYQAGTVTFKNKTINKISTIFIYFDFRESLYNHSTYAVRGHATPSQNLKIGATYIDDSDGLKDASAIFQNASSEPQSHYLIGTDCEFSLFEKIKGSYELAYSSFAPNLLTNNSYKEEGKAGKANLSLDLSPLTLTGRYKRVGAKFLRAGEASPKQGLTEYSSIFEFNPSGQFLSEARFDESKYAQDGTNYNISSKGSRIRLKPNKLPSAEYIIDDIIESNDPVTGISIDRLTLKQSLELQHDLGILRSNAKGWHEKRVNRTPSEETTVYKAVNLGLSLLPQNNFSASGNFEIKKTSYPSGQNPMTKTAVVNVSASPKKDYMLSGTLNYIDDDMDGVSQVTDISFKAEPAQSIKTSGKYKISALTETFGSTSEGIRKEEGSLNLELRPIERLKVRYNYKPNFTVLNRTHGTTYNNQIQLVESSLFLFKETLLGYSYQFGNAFTIDKTDYPNYKRKQSAQDSANVIYSIKTAPLKFLSCEFNYILDGSKNLTLSSTGEETYLRANSSGKELNASVKTSLSESIAFDSSYSYKKSYLGSGGSESDSGNTRAQTASLKIIFNPNGAVTISPTYAYSQSTNYLLSDDRDTYTVQPGIEFTLRLIDRLRVDGNGSYAKSHAGATTEKTNCKLQGRYDVSDYLHVTLRAESEISRNPDYKISDFAGSVEINL